MKGQLNQDKILESDENTTGIFIQGEVVVLLHYPGMQQQHIVPLTPSL